MNEAMNTILNRRSIRVYKREQILDEELELILTAGKYAPSGMNWQSWHFTVIQNPELINKLNEYLKAFLLKSGNKEMIEQVKSKSFNIFYFAPTVIIVSGNKNAMTPQTDCALAFENMFLAAESIGIGSCWIHPVSIALTSTVEGRVLTKELKIPEGYIIHGAAVFGYKTELNPPALPRRKDTVTIIR
jgi:nitroreductase